ncbi:Zinc finger protein interacting with ribonucleoprotein K [Myotis brandtii]|uniref:Zinc finger protein interacting with ribonucleoprotein K n=1 Tax=Myotis brandtii TaxID=109478 RepID=S7MCU4_MYOBR|nr:Zinc finger protein interacting with ribonucleoprotein K [Myotis brandtii]
MNFEDMAIAFSQEEWGLVDEAQRLLYCDVMLEVFALVSSVGCYHKTDDAEDCSEQSVSVQGESQDSASKTAPETQRTHLCGRCFSLLKDILHLPESEAADFEQKAFFSDACDMDFEDVAIAFSQEEWGLLDEAQRLLYCDVMLEVFALVSFVVIRPQSVCFEEVNDEGNTFGKVSTRIFNLNRQKRVHTRKKLYECTDCGKFFRESSSLIQHRRVHTGEKPYECTDCGKFFRQCSTLTQHKRVHTGEKPYVCGDCGRSFRHKCGLNSHRRTHTGEKPYVCGDCGRSFSQKCSPNSHQRVHTGAKLYECSECGKSCGSSHHLLNHKRIHAGEKPYRRSDCGKSFSQNCNLKSHQRTQTGKGAVGRNATV